MKVELTEDGYTPDRKMRLVPVTLSHAHWRKAEYIDGESYYRAISSAPNPPAHYFDKPEAPIPDADGWIPWYGGECPIPDAKADQYQVRFRHDDDGPCMHPRFDAKHLGWNHDDSDDNIIAYRIIGDGHAQQ